MGWLYMQTLDGYADPKGYLDAQFTFSRPEGHSKVLRSELVGDRVYYAAVEQVLAAAGERTVWALICLVDFDPRRADGYIFGYKDMSEGMGPHECDCPVPILDILTPTEKPYAVAWRSKCRQRAAAIAAGRPDRAD